jgi:hypothetical protein
MFDKKKSLIVVCSCTLILLFTPTLHLYRVLYSQPTTIDHRLCLTPANWHQTSSAGDGIPDIWKEKGIDSNCDGTIDLNLRALGANPNHKDVFVQVDSMTQQRFLQEAENIVKQAFLNAPVHNPDGIDGINLIIIHGHTNIPQQESISINDLPGIESKWIGNSTDTNNTKAAKMAIFHYALFAQDQSDFPGSSGIGFGIPSMSFMVTLGGQGWGADPNDTSHNIGNVDQQAGTFLHELGHTLGLRHGGVVDLPRFAPNYFSVMGYAYQLRGSGVGDRPYSYSSCIAPSLDENHLTGNLGIGNAACPNSPPWPHAVIWGGQPYGGFCPPHSMTIVPTHKAISFGASQGDISCDQLTQTLPLRTLYGFNDWNHLIYIVKPNPNGGVAQPSSRHPDITFVEVKSQSIESLLGVARAINNISTSIPPAAGTAGIGLDIKKTVTSINRELGVSPVGGGVASVGGKNTVFSNVIHNNFTGAIQKLTEIEAKVNSLPSSSAGVSGLASALSPQQNALDAIQTYRLSLESLLPYK